MITVREYLTSLFLAVTFTLVTLAGMALPTAALLYLPPPSSAVVAILLVVVLLFAVGWAYVRTCDKVLRWWYGRTKRTLTARTLATRVVPCGVLVWVAVMAVQINAPGEGWSLHTILTGCGCALMVGAGALRALASLKAAEG